MREVQVWENVLIWGRAQNPDLLYDVANYSKDALQQCIIYLLDYTI
jgi:hypothetical protein